jgi:hypothetical protein
VGFDLGGGQLRHQTVVDRAAKRGGRDIDQSECERPHPSPQGDHGTASDEDELARQLSALAQALQAEDHVDNTGSHGIGPGRSNPGGIPPDHDYLRHLSTGDPVYREPRNRRLHAGIVASG